MKFKYKVNQTVILTPGVSSHTIFRDSPWDEPKIRRISEVYVDESMGYDTPGLPRYRLDGLWFNEDEIQLVSKESHPEYYL